MKKVDIAEFGGKLSEFALNAGAVMTIGAIFCALPPIAAIAVVVVSGEQLSQSQHLEFVVWGESTLMLVMGVLGMAVLFLSSKCPRIVAVIAWLSDIRFQWPGRQ